MVAKKKAIIEKDPRNEILDNFPFWRREGVDAFISIKGFTDLLLSSKVGELNEQQKSFIKNIRSVASRGAMGLMSNGDYLQFTYRLDKVPLQLQRVSLGEVCEKIATRDSILSLVQESLKIELPTDLPAVKADFHHLFLAIFYLIEPSAIYWYKPILQAIITARSDDDYVLIRIQSPIVFPEEPSLDLKLPGSSISVANLLLEKHGSKLQLVQVSRSDKDTFDTIFEFALPIWKENPI